MATLNSTETKMLGDAQARISACGRLINEVIATASDKERVKLARVQIELKKAQDEVKTVKTMKGYYPA